MSAVIPVTKEWLSDFIKEQIGQARAELRKELEARGKEIAERTGGIPAGIRAGLDGLTPARSAEPQAGQLLPRLIASIAAGKGRGDVGLAFAEKVWGRDTKGMEPVLKTLAAGDFTGAGALIDGDISDDFIEILRPKVVVRRLGARIEPMPSGTTKIRKQTQASQASYVGENRSPNASQPAHGHLVLTAKSLVAKVPISNKAIRYVAAGRRAINLDQRVQNDAVQQIRRREDIAFIRDPGTENTPRGIRHLVPAGNVETMTASPDYAKVVTDLAKLLTNLRNGDVPIEAPGWMFAPRVRTYLETLLTTDGHYAFRAEMLAGALWGFPFGDTSQIPTNLGGGGNQTEVYLADFDEVVIGETGNMTVSVTTEGSYVDADGNVQSAFDNDETVIRVETEHDIGLRHDGAASVLTEVTWGA